MAPEVFKVSEFAFFGSFCKFSHSWHHFLDLLGIWHDACDQYRPSSVGFGYCCSKIMTLEVVLLVKTDFFES